MYIVQNKTGGQLKKADKRPKNAHKNSKNAKPSSSDYPKASKMLRNTQIVEFDNYAFDEKEIDTRFEDKSGQVENTTDDGLLKIVEEGLEEKTNTITSTKDVRKTINGNNKDVDYDTKTNMTVTNGHKTELFMPNNTDSHANRDYETKTNLKPHIDTNENVRKNKTTINPYTNEQKLGFVDKTNNAVDKIEKKSSTKLDETAEAVENRRNAQTTRNVDSKSLDIMKSNNRTDHNEEDDDEYEDKDYLYGDLDLRKNGEFKAVFSSISLCKPESISFKGVILIKYQANSKLILGVTALHTGKN